MSGVEWLVVAQAVAEAQSDATDRRMLCAPMLSSLCLGLRAEAGVVCRAQQIIVGGGGTNVQVIQGR